jgi:curved DNA-binding protein CbpA
MSLARALALFSLVRGATRGDARRAYRRLAVETHPDHGGDDRAFREIGGALELLLRELPDGPPNQVVATLRFRIRSSEPAIAPGGDYERWQGADWTGASSGVSWLPTPPPMRRRSRR